MANCSSRTCIYNRTAVPSSGPVPAEVMVVLEAPGYWEVQRGMPAVGPAGRILDSCLAEVGLERKNVRVANTVQCVDFSREDRKPTPTEITACRARLLADVINTSPAVIIAMGGISISAFFPDFGKHRVGAYRGKIRAFPSNGQVVSVIATYHPAAALGHRNPELKGVIIEDLKTVILLKRGGILKE